MLCIFGFMDGNLLVGKEFPGWTLENFKKIVSTGIFSKLMLKTIGIGLLVTVVCIIIAYPTAWAIAKIIKSKNRNFFVMLIIIPFFTSQLLLIYSMMNILQSGGLLLTLLENLGFSNVESIVYTNAATVVVLIYEYLPYMVLCLYSSMESINDNIVQASHSLGAGILRTFTNVVFPMSVPGLLSGVLLVFVPVCGSFAEPALVGGPNGMMVGSLINSQYSDVLNMGYGAALSFIFLIILSIIMTVIRWCVSRTQRKIGGSIYE